MMELRIFVVAISICSFLSCKKDSNNPPKAINNNKLTAQVTVLDRPEREFISTGDSTLFFKRIDSFPGRADSVIVIYGDDGIGNLDLTLINISTPGTYAFQPADTLGTNVSVSFYSEGGYPSLTLLASSAGADVAGNPYASGSFTILKLTDTEIEGRFHTIMKNGEPEVVIKNAYFKGKFQD